MISVTSAGPCSLRAPVRGSGNGAIRRPAPERRGRTRATYTAVVAPRAEIALRRGVRRGGRAVGNSAVGHVDRMRCVEAFKTRGRRSVVVRSAQLL